MNLPRIKGRWAAVAAAATAAVATFAIAGTLYASAAPAPANLHVTGHTDTTLTLAWTGSASQVQVYDDSTNAQLYRAFTNSTTATTWTATGLPAGTAVDARIVVGGQWTAPVHATTTAAAGVVSVGTLTGHATLAAIGGSWTTGHTAVKSEKLAAGTYLVTLTGDFYKTATTTATPVLQIQLNGGSIQLTGYTGAFPYNTAEATGDSGGPSFAPNGLEQTANAYGIITIPSGGATVEIDAFGYNPDRGGEGGGDFAVNASASFVLVTAAS